MNYVSVNEARARPGLRLVLTAGVPGPWGEAAKSIFHVKGIEYAPVAQYAGMPNEELIEWTTHANAPVAVYDGEAPRSGWAEILFLAERLRPEPRLIPDDAAERTVMFGISHEICGENGFGWARRLMLIDSLMAPEAGEVGNRAGKSLGARYGYTKENAAKAPARVAAILAMLAGRLARQHEAGSSFLVGASLSAADIYWAAFAVLLDPLPAGMCPMPDYLRAWYTNLGPVVAGALDPVLLEHRDFVYRTYLEIPMSF